MSWTTFFTSFFKTQPQAPKKILHEAGFYLDDIDPISKEPLKELPNPTVRAVRIPYAMNNSNKTTGATWWNSHSLSRALFEENITQQGPAKTDPLGRPPVGSKAAHETFDRALRTDWTLDPRTYNFIEHYGSKDDIPIVMHLASFLHVIKYIIREYPKHTKIPGIATYNTYNTGTHEIIITNRHLPYLKAIVTLNTGNKTHRRVSLITLTFTHTEKRHDRNVEVVVKFPLHVHPSILTNQFIWSRILTKTVNTRKQEIPVTFVTDYHSVAETRHRHVVQHNPFRFPVIQDSRNQERNQERMKIPGTDTPIIVLMAAVADLLDMNLKIEAHPQTIIPTKNLIKPATLPIKTFIEQTMFKHKNHHVSNTVDSIIQESGYIVSFLFRFLRLTDRAYAVKDTLIEAVQFFIKAAYLIDRRYPLHLTRYNLKGRVEKIPLRRSLSARVIPHIPLDNEPVDLEFVITGAIPARPQDNIHLFMDVSRMSIKYDRVIFTGSKAGLELNVHHTMKMTATEGTRQSSDLNPRDVHVTYDVRVEDYPVYENIKRYINFIIDDTKGYLQSPYQVK